MKPTAFTGCGVNPARTFGPSVVTCMAGGDCSAVAGSWYWIYYVGPFLASYLVAELTLIMEMDVGDATDEPTEELLESPKETYPETDAMKATQEATKEAPIVEPAMAQSAMEEASENV